MKVSSVDHRVDDGMQDKQSNIKMRASSMRPKSQSPSKPTSTIKPKVSFLESDEKKEEDAHPSQVQKEPKKVASIMKDSTFKPGKGQEYRVKNVKRVEAPGKAEDSSTHPKSLLSTLGKRLPFRFGEKKKGFIRVGDTMDDEDCAVEEDPVISIFESRNTQRVRFSIEDGGEKRHTKREEHSSEKNAATNITSFMSRALFGSQKTSNKLKEEMQREVAELGGSLVWESTDTPTGPEVIHTNSNKSRTGAAILLSFTEDPKARSSVAKLLKKARRAEHIHFRYEYGVKCYVKALGILKKAKYPDDHPTVQKVMRLLNNAHHVLSSYKNSANIVKMGIKYEDSGELVRALKMYTIAYRIRRDNLSRNHPSLVVLLNMLGSIQIKRGELQEAMKIYELALKDSPVIFNASEDEEEEAFPISGNLLAKSVTYREMGTINERWGNVEEALNLYHKSLECVADWKDAILGDDSGASNSFVESSAVNADCSLKNVQLTRSDMSSGDNAGEDPSREKGEMELVLSQETQTPTSALLNRNSVYESFFPAHLELELKKQGSNAAGAAPNRDTYADLDLALTLHQIAQLHRCQGQYEKALDAYAVALRGMKYALGKHHPNVAAILGNIGNLQKEMGDMDGAFNTYQEVLGIESYRLGLSHPDVAITLHNIATIDAARGNYDHALTLYRKVLGLQKKLFGEDHLSVSVTAACMGDVYEKLGELKNAMESYEESFRIKSAATGRHSLEVSRLLHKLGKLALRRGDFHQAESFISRAVLVYRLNKLDDNHEWVIDAYKDTADIDGAILMGGGKHFEC